LSAAASRVAVVGGGLGGLAAACTLAARGHAVELFEKNPWLGCTVAVLEEHRIAWNASGRNDGFVLPGFALSMAACATTTSDSRSLADRLNCASCLLRPSL